MGQLIPLPPKATAPAAPTAAPPAAPVPTRDVIGRAKAAVTDPSEAGRLWPRGPRIGPQVLAPVGTFLRGAGEFVLPGSFEQLATQAILGGVPGIGKLPALGRVAGAGGAGAAISAAKGEDPLTAAGEQAATALGGELLGGVARSVFRRGAAALSRTTENVGDLIGDLVPAFKGRTPADTIRRVISGEGQRALSKEYGEVVKNVIAIGNDPLVRVPALVELGRKGPSRQFPELFRASKALEGIQAVHRAGRPEQISLVRAARDEFDENLSRLIPPEAQRAFVEVRGRYARGQAIKDWFEGGVKLLQKGRLNEPELEKAFLESRGALSRTFTPQEFGRLERAVTRGERAPLRMSETERPGHAWVHVPPLPVGMGVQVQRAPIRIGAPEERAEMAARAVRMLGQRGAMQMVEE